MSVQADDARAKVIHCETLDNEQKAKMLLLINTKPDTTLPVFTGVPDFLLGHTLSVHLEGMTADRSSEIAVDKTARKVAQLAQLVQGSPPSFKNLEAFLFRHSDVKLPVLDAKYYSLIAANEGLMSEIEPASKSGAEALAEVVTTALRIEYEPVSDEISLAGYVDMLLWHVWRCMETYDQGPKLGMRRKRNCAEDSATVKGKRPDLSPQLKGYVVQGRGQDIRR
ncbi:TPA: hypothetical protein ACH3X1_016272 [Trebouxia sp. C0004]